MVIENVMEINNTDSPSELPTSYFEQYRQSKLTGIPIEKKAKPKTEKVRFRINPLSAKREKQNREYLVLVNQFKIDNPFCIARFEGCTVYTTTAHHSQGRIGALLTDVSKLKPLCFSCHERVEQSPEMAKELGLSVNRIK